MIGSDTVADQSERGGQLLEHVDSNVFLVLQKKEIEGCIIIKSAFSIHVYFMHELMP